MLEDLEFNEVICYVILFAGASYLYKAINQIFKKDIEFFNKELYTDKSVKNWAVCNGILKLATSFVCILYSFLCMIGITAFWYVAVAFVSNIVLYVILYRKILVKKEDA